MRCFAIGLMLLSLQAATGAQAQGENDVLPAPVTVPATATPPRVAEALGILKKCPSWVWTHNKTPARTRIMAALEELARYDLDTLEAAIGLLFEQNPTSMQTYNVYVLNRLVFDVPRQRPKGMRAFDCFQGRGKLDPWWPLSSTSDGRLVLTGEYAGYTGEAYRGLDEFKHFRELFQRRRASRWTPREVMPGGQPHG